MNQSGWVANNAMVIVGQTTVTQNKTAISRDGTNGSTLAPNLRICYTQNTPTITTSGTLSSFSSQPGVPSTAQSYTVSGTNLTADIVITAPTDFQISTDNVTFDSSLTLTQTGGIVGSMTIYARMNRATEGTPSGNISHTSTNATTRNVAVSGTVLYVYTLTAGNDGHGSVTLSPAGGSYNNGTTVTLTPVPDTGYAFSSWSGTNAGDIIDTSGVYTIVMNGNKTVSANFVVSLCSDITLYATADNWLRASQATTNYGGATTLSINPNGTNSQFALLRWDLSSIPANATINSASLTLYVTDISSNTYYLYDLLRTWVEGIGTTDNTPSTTSSNWNTYNGVNTWGTGGAQNTTSDRNNTNLWGAGTTTFNALGDATVALNASGLTVVRGWYNTPTSNYGLTIQNPATASNYLIIASREAATEAQRPRLNLNYCVIPTGPTITTTGTLTAFSAPVGTPSVEQSYTVAGTNLGTNPIVVTPPTDFELSLTSGSGFLSTPISLTPSGGTVATTNIYVRLNPTTATTYSANITNASTDATTQNVAITGSSVPAITATSSMTAFSAPIGSASAEQSYTVSGLRLTAPIVVTPPTDFEVSTTGGGIGFGSSVSLTPVSGTVSTTTIYVRLNPTTATTYSANITNVSGTATQNVAVTGSSVPTITTTGTLASFSAAIGMNSAQQSYSVSGLRLTDAIVITPPADFFVSTTSGSGYVSTLSLTTTAGVVSSTTIYVIFNRSTAGTSSGNIAHTASGATAQNVAVSGTANPPTINAMSSMTAFSSLINVPSAEQTYTVAGGYLTGDITVTAPTGYQISITSGSDFGCNLVLPQVDGSVATATIYVRLMSLLLLAPSLAISPTPAPAPLPKM